MKFKKGDILVPKETQFPEGALVVDGYDEAGRLMAHPMGGGLQFCIEANGAEGLRLVDEAERARVVFRRGTFVLAESEEQFSGWTDGRLWNGWEMPRFEKAEAERLVRWLSAERGRFDKEKDAFITGMQGDEDEVWAGESIVISDGSVLKGYPVGAGSWIWETLQSTINPQGPTEGT